MSSIEKVGLNISGLNNITSPEFNFSSDINTFVTDIPVKANEYTNGHLSTIMLSSLFFYLYYKIADLGATGEFRYSKIRSLAISSAISGIVGMMFLTMGYFTKAYPVIFFLLVFMVSFVWVVKEEK